MLPQCNIKVIFQSKNCLSKLFRLKKAFPKNFVSTLFTYFCVVIATLLITVKLNAPSLLGPENNLRESLSALTGKRVTNNKKSAVKDHCLPCNHVGTFEDFSILMYESNPFKLLIKESLLVSRDKPLLNKQLKSIPLQLFQFTFIINYCSLDNLYIVYVINVLYS